MIRMLQFRSLAESWRILSNRRMRSRAEIVANNVLASSENPYTPIYFLYSVEGGNRLSDEDFHEIYYILTGAYPDEVYDEPDPIHLLSLLSETEVTDITAASVVSRIQLVLSASDNEERSRILRPCFYRINRLDLFSLFMRLSTHAAPVSRRDIVKAISIAYDTPFHQVRSSVNLLGVEHTINALRLGEFDYTKIRPLIGKGLIIPAPVIVSKTEEVMFGKCFVERLEGVYVSLHYTPQSLKMFDVAGLEIDGEGWLDGWVEIARIPYGIFLCDYAVGRDNPLMLVDWLSPDDPNWTYKRRRKPFEDLPNWSVKQMIELDAPCFSDGIAATDNAYILRNAAGILSYENTKSEVVMVQVNEAPKRILRILSGRVAESPTGGPPVLLWALGARDGLEYIQVGEAESFFDFQKWCEPYRRIEGTVIKMTSPLFVSVDVHSSGWGDIGPYIKADIVGIESAAGISECMGAEELGYADIE